MLNIFRSNGDLRREREILGKLVQMYTAWNMNLGPMRNLAGSHPGFSGESTELFRISTTSRRGCEAIAFAEMGHGKVVLQQSFFLKDRILTE